MVPFRLANMKRAEPPSPLVNRKDEAFPLLTWPVGPTAPAPPGGMLGAVVGFFIGGVTDTLNSDAVLVAWFEVQKGLVSLCETPHGFFRLGSMSSAGRKPSETRLVWS